MSNLYIRVAAIQTAHTVMLLGSVHSCPACGMYMCDARSCDLPFVVPCPDHAEYAVPHTMVRMGEQWDDTDATGAELCDFAAA